MIAPVSLLALLVAACLSPAAAELAWSYHVHAPTGPSHWATLNDSATGALLYPSCSGIHQSPIDLVSPTHTSASLPLTESYGSGCSTVEVQYLEEEFKWSYVGVNTCYVTSSLSGAPKPYSLLQFHVHSPSEHSVNGELLAAEVHFVHKSADGGLLVIGVMLEAKIGHADNDWIAAAFKHLDALSEPGSPDVVRNEVLDPLLLIPETGGMYQYTGSLTQPPCSEPVEWWVAAKTVPVSATQLYALLKQQELSKVLRHGANNRPVQPLNGRVITKYA